MKKPKTGRPKLSPGEQTIHVGFTVPKSLWLKFVAESKKTGLTKSALFRTMVTDWVASK